MRKKKKLCILTGFVIKSSSQSNIALKKAEIFSKYGYEVTVIFHRRDDYGIYISDNFKVIYLNSTIAKFDLGGTFLSGSFGMMGMLFYFYHLLKKKYDIIYTFTGHRPAIFIPAYTSKLIHKSKIVTEWWEWYGRGGYADLRKGFFGKLVSIYETLFELFLIQKYHAIIAISSGLKDRLEDSKKIYVINGAIDTSLFEYSKDSVRQELGINRNIFLIGMSGVSKGEESDMSPFFIAFKNIAMEYDDVYLILTGDEEYIDRVKSRYSMDNIINIGWTDYKTYNKYLSSCDIFVLPYPATNRNIGRWPNKIGDYIKLRKPIISNPTGDLIDYFKNYEIGELCCNNITEYYSAIDRYYHNRHLLEIELNDYVKLERLLSIENRCNKINAIIKKL